MLANPQTKYQRFAVEPFTQRTWCNNQLTHAPRWCSSDLRDGNQALINPMDMEKKLYLFNHLVQIGFKEIEVAFPSASETDFNFVQHLINEKLIPNDVWIQVITQSRPELIEKTFDSLQGVSKAIVHLYNATAPVFREVVFGQDKVSTIDLAVNGAKLITQKCAQNPAVQWQFEYSPETFCFTEREFALEICEAVKNVWQPTEERPMIINLPATVEMNTPNVYADQIEWFITNFSDLSHITISVHPHNDRGTGVACAELAMLAGATRVEGCLFGNGERTGNVDLVTLALNLYTQGITPNLNFANLQQTAEVITFCNELPIHPRHPYAGELVFTAFSGSHQDAIKKGFTHWQGKEDGIWNVPYFTIDPKDIGASYEAVIRVNSQSGKSGSAWLLETHHGIKLPRAFQIDFSQRVKEFTHQQEKEANIAEIWQLFRESYGLTSEKNNVLTSFEGKNTANHYELSAQITLPNQDSAVLEGVGNGLLSAFINSINTTIDNILEKFAYGSATTNLVANWLRLRELCLKYPQCISEEQYQKLYKIFDKAVNKYYFRQERDYQYVATRTERFDGCQTIDLNSSRLPIFMQHAGLKHYFEQQGYATSLHPSTIWLNPVMFNNIYKGALGEVCGKFLWEDYGLPMLEELPLHYYERFDFQVSPSIHVDFKHWQENQQNGELNRNKIFEKMDIMDSKLVFVINMISDSNDQLLYNIHHSEDKSKEIVEIPNFLPKARHLDLINKIQERINAHADH